MRARYPLAAVTAGLAILACIPHPESDFDDYAKEAAKLAQEAGGGSFEGSAPPVEAVEGLYYGACLSQLALGQRNRVFNFYTETKYEPDPAGGGKLTMKLSPLTVRTLESGEKGPPETVTRAGISLRKVNPNIGQPTTYEIVPTAPNVAAADGRYSFPLGVVEPDVEPKSGALKTVIAGDANPITGRDVVIENAALSGFFGSKFCARLTGDVVVPLVVSLEPDRNICQFVPVKDGDPTPTFTPEDFKAGSCPF